MNRYSLCLLIAIAYIALVLPALLSCFGGAR